MQRAITVDMTYSPVVCFMIVTITQSASQLTLWRPIVPPLWEISSIESGASGTILSARHHSCWEYMWELRVLDRYASLTVMSDKKYWQGIRPDRKIIIKWATLLRIYDRIITRRMRVWSDFQNCNTDQAIAWCFMFEPCEVSQVTRS